VLSRRGGALAACALLCALLALPAQAGAVRRVPVVLVAFDEFPTTSLLGKHRRLDRVRFPNFARLAGDATWYRNATGVHDSTFAAIPAIIDGRGPRYRKGRSRRPPSQSLLSLLARRGWRVRASVEAGGVCPRRFCPGFRTTRYYLVRNRLSRFTDFVSRIGPSRRPTLWFKHSLIPHLPWLYLPSGRQYQRRVRGPIRGINSELGVHDRYLVRFAYQRHLLQVQAVDRVLGSLLARLKSTGLYNRALVVVMADHGISFRLHEEDRRTLTRANVQNVAPVPLFIKRPGQRRGRISRVYARTYDVLPTIADLLNVRVPWRINGRSVFSRAVRRRRTVRMEGRDHRDPVVKLSARAFQARWSRAITYHHAVFGVGGRGPGLYGIGPNRRLRGRPLTLRRGRLRVGSARVARAGRVRARIALRHEFRNVDFRSRYRPALVAGRITGRRRGRRRNLAVAVNDRVVGVGRSFRLRHRRREFFAVLVPESSLRPGRNRVRVLGVGRRGRRLRFRLLGAA
jgi:Sulfatase